VKKLIKPIRTYTRTTGDEIPKNQTKERLALSLSRVPSWKRVLAA
jgi:hypothetical protein